MMIPSFHYVHVSKSDVHTDIIECSSLVSHTPPIALNNLVLTMSPLVQYLIHI